MPVAQLSDQALALLAPMLYDRAATDLPVYLTALCGPFQIVQNYASDDPDTGAPGYSLWVDADRVPAEAIPWLAQFVGATITPQLDYDSQIAQLKGLNHWKRGTPASLVAAAYPYLTGSHTVIIKERDTSPYHFEVITLGSETPDPAQVLKVLKAAKPVGLVMNYVVDSGQKAFTMRDSALRSPDALREII